LGGLHFKWPKWCLSVGGKEGVLWGILLTSGWEGLVRVSQLSIIDARPILSTVGELL
jgi:hypothetical protein